LLHLLIRMRIEGAQNLTAGRVHTLVGHDFPFRVRPP
jgi:hypothetical protein